jgi:SAM-dependent methyltransferase
VANPASRYDAPVAQSERAATVAGVYDYLLGGVHNVPADREVARTVVATFPMAAAGIRANRAFLRRAVRDLTASGQRQFLDIGSGMPTVGNVHEIARGIATDAQVVYVDKDPVVVAESRSILAGDENAIAIAGDLLDPPAYLDHPEVRRRLDFDQPIVVLLVALLHFVADDAAAYAAVERIRGALATGSYLVLSHSTDDGAPIDPDRYAELKDSYRQQAAATGRLRSRAEVARFFDGFELIDPGLVWVPQWRPRPDEPTELDDPRLSLTLAGVGRRPL